MESFPGAFPGIYTGGRDSTPSLIEPLNHETINYKKSLKSQKELFRSHFMAQIELLCYVYIVITYLYDCSLILLILRSLILLSLFIILHSTSVESKKSIRSVYYSILFINTLSVVTHYKRDLHKPNSDGFVYGHHTLQIIGQLQLNNKRCLYFLDTLIFLSQMLLYSSVFYTDKESSMNNAILLENEFDGWQGRTIPIKINILNAFKTHFINIEELKAQQVEQDRRETQALTEQLPGSYGSNSSE